MDVDLAASRRLTGGIRASAQRQTRGARARWRAAPRVDERFDPGRRWPRTAPLLEIAQRALRPRRPGRRLLPHGHRQPAERARALRRRRPAYAQLYFDSTPLRHAAAYEMLASSATTRRRTAGACSPRGRSCACSATNPAELERWPALQTQKGSAENVLHPRGRDRGLRDARRHPGARGRQRSSPAGAARPRAGCARDRHMGELAPRARPNRRCTARCGPRRWPCSATSGGRAGDLAARAARW